MGKKPKQNKWKVVDPGGNFTDLISIEELVDYKAIRGKDQYSEPTVDDESILTKKRKKKKTATAKKRKLIDQTEQPPAPKKTKFQEETSLNIEEQSSIDMSAWEPFNLPKPIIKALATKKFSVPTEIQVIIV